MGEYYTSLPQDVGARERFQLIATAYEVGKHVTTVMWLEVVVMWHFASNQILKDEEERANYDYMLDNPGMATQLLTTHPWKAMSLPHTLHRIALIFRRSLISRIWNRSRN